MEYFTYSVFLDHPALQIILFVNGKEMGRTRVVRQGAETAPESTVVTFDRGVFQ